MAIAAALDGHAPWLLKEGRDGPGAYAAAKGAWEAKGLAEAERAMERARRQRQRAAAGLEGDGDSVFCLGDSSELAMPWHEVLGLLGRLAAAGEAASEAGGGDGSKAVAKSWYALAAEEALAAEAFSIADRFQKLADEWAEKGGAKSEAGRVCVP